MVFLPTFRDNLSLPYSRVKQSKYHSTPRKLPEERSSHLTRGGNLKLRKINLIQRASICSQIKIILVKFVSRIDLIIDM
jgi:hypothetical protein